MDLRIDPEVHAETVNCPLKLLTAVFVIPLECGHQRNALSDSVLVAGTDNIDIATVFSS